MARTWREAQQRELAFWRSIYEECAPDLPTYTPASESRALMFTAKILERFEVSQSDLKGGRLVDLGSGPIGLVRGLSELPAVRRMYALDPLIDKYQGFSTFPADARLSLIAAKGEALPFANGSVDWIFSVNVLDHVEDPEAVLRECARVLKSAGALCIEGHVVRQPWPVVSPAMKYLDANHPHHFTSDTFVNMAKRVFGNVQMTRSVRLIEDQPDFTLSRMLRGPQRVRALKRFCSRAVLKTIYLKCRGPRQA